MALGSSWGTREEMLHPRDRRGRFRKKWKMPDGVINKLQAFLERFNPRTFQSDQQASQYLFNRAKPARFPGDGRQRLHMDWDEANDHIRAGDVDPSTQRFIQMMEGASVPMQEQLILHRTVGPEAFGLTPDQLGLEDGGLQDFTGRLIADRAYSATNIGSPMGTGPGRIHMTIATPRGQQAIIPASDPNDRRVFLPRDQGYRITKVEPDGTGGWNVMAIAEPAGVARKTPEPIMPGRRGAGLSEAQREGRITPSMSPAQRQAIAQQNEREMQTGANAPTPAPAQGQPAPAQPTPAPAPAAPAPAPAPAVQGPTSPATGVPERREPIQREAVGPTAPSGTSPAEIAQAGQEAARQAAEVQAAPAPATPDSFKRAVQDAKVDIPSRGQRRAEWNNAYLGLKSGKKDPVDTLRELDQDIADNKIRAESHTPDPSEKAVLEKDIKAQEQLADVISSHYGVPRRGQEAPAAEAPTPAPAAPAKRATRTAAKAAPAAPAAKKAAKAAGPTPTPGAPSTTKEATPKAPAPKKAAKRAPAEVADALKSAGTREEADAHLEGLTTAELRQVATETGTVGIGARSTKAQLRQAIVQKTTGRRLDSDAISGNGRRMRGDDTTDTERRLIEAAKKYRGKERNSEEKRIVDEADKILARRQGTEAPVAKKAAPEAPAPTKAAPKKAAPAKAAPAPVNAEEEAFQQRVKDAGLPDRVTELRAQAREKKIRGFSTMTKAQLQRALLGEEVPRASKIAPVTPAKLVPHLEAAKSEQEARKLLENHTLTDLKELAKSRGLEIPKRGATKDKLKDMVLADVRGGPEPTTKGEMPARSLRQELDAQKWVEPEAPDVRDRVQQEINQTEQTDPESLREHRDNLEAYAKEVRAGGNRQDANLIQTLADTMGMRAQTISGVEEPAVRAPVKRVAKAAVPEVTAPEGPKPLDKMLKTELAKVAEDEQVPGIRKSMTKAQLKDAIEAHRRVREGQGPKAAPTERAPTPEEIARDNPVAQKRALKRVPKGSVAGPRTDQPITAPSRRDTFNEAWNSRGLTAPGAAGRSLDEVRGDIASGKITPEEGVRRIESDIAFNKDDIADIDAELRGLAPGDRTLSARRRELNVQKRQLQESIHSQENASRFVREHFREEAPTTLPELEVQLGPKEKAALDRVDVPSLKEAARQDGLGEIDGTTKDEVIQNIAKAAARRELANREEDRARAHQAKLDEVRGRATALAELDQMDLNEGSDRALSVQINNLTNTGQLTPELQQKLLAAVPDRTKFRRLVAEETKKAGLTPVGDVGTDVPFDLKKHTPAPGADIAPGDQVTVIRRGHRGKVAGKEYDFGKATVIPAAPGPAPEAAPVVSRRPGQANPSASSLKTGARILAMQDPSGKWTRTSRKTGSRVITVNRIDRVQVGNQSGYQIHGTDDDGNKITMEPIFGQNTLTLEPPPKTPRPTKATKATKKAAQVALSPRDVQAQLSDIENPPSREEAKALLERHVQGRDLRAMARELHIPTSGKANDQIRDEIVEATAGRLTDAKASRGFGGRTPTSVPVRTGESTGVVADVARRAAKAAVPAKAAPVVDAKQPDRLHARTIGSGIVFQEEDDKWLANVQHMLDEGTDGRQIADNLRREADRVRTTGAVQEAVAGNGESLGTRADRMELLADRMEGVRPIKKVAATKAAKKAAPVSDRETLTGPIGEVIANQLNDTARRVTEAKSEQEASDALSGLLAPELRTLAKRVGVPTSGTKDALKKRIADRLRGTEAPTTSVARALPEGPAVRHASVGLTDGGRIKKIDRAKADEPIHLPNNGNDQGLMHLDSSMGELWAALYEDQREPNSFINELARLGDDLGLGKADLQDDVLPKLRDLKARASDKAVADRIQKTIDEIDAPPVQVPDLPEGVPASVKNYLEQLAHIPTARKTGRIGASTVRQSVLDQQVDLIRRISRGEVDYRQASSMLRKRHLHESADGATRMWSLAERLFNEVMPKFDQQGKLLSGNPEWPAIRDWLRASIVKPT